MKSRDTDLTPDEWTVFEDEYHDYLANLEAILYERALDGDREQLSYEEHYGLWRR